MGLSRVHTSKCDEASTVDPRVSLCVQHWRMIILRWMRRLSFDPLEKLKMGVPAPDFLGDHASHEKYQGRIPLSAADADFPTRNSVSLREFRFPTPFATLARSRAFDRHFVADSSMTGENKGLRTAC